MRRLLRLLCSSLALSGPVGIGCSAPPPALVPESERGVDVGADLTPPLSLPDGRALRVIAGGDPGETDLFLDGVALAPHAGPDELPLLLTGGAQQVVFVSGRSGVASLWRVDVDGADLVQLTNLGQRPGHLDERFVPPPARSMTQDGDDVVYDDGSGRVVRVPVRAAAGSLR